MTALQHERLPTVAELRAMSDAELVERHDALVRSQPTGASISDIYLGELGRRMAELQAERTARIALLALIASGVAVVVTLLVLVVAF